MFHVLGACKGTSLIVLIFLVKTCNMSNKMLNLGIESVGHIGKDSTTTEASKKHY